MNTNSNYISVSELSKYLKNYLEGNSILQDIYVYGEISNFKHQSNGHMYFSLKDESSIIRCCMFAFNAIKVDFAINDGMSVFIHGKISLYEPGGTYSIVVDSLKYDKIGELYKRFEETKAKLLSEGLFSDSYKKELPKYPKKIGIVTALTGAAIHDMVRTIYDRYPLASIYLFPCQVQGEDAPKSIIKALNQADSYHLDVIITGRGGGSFEELFAFNDEELARYIFKMNTPIISAVGHQNDFSISDFVADLRALTPTDAAMKATPTIDELIKTIDLYKVRFNKEINKKVNDFKASYLNSFHNLEMNSPIKKYERYAYKFDILNNRLLSVINSNSVILHHKINDYKNSLNHTIVDIVKNNKFLYLNLYNKLNSLSPINSLDRGYSVTYNQGHIISSIDDVNVNDSIEILLKDGKIKAKVEEKTNG